MSAQYIADNGFEKGFTVHGPRHADGTIARFRPTEGTRWNIAQWGVYKHPLTQDAAEREIPGGWCRETDTLRIEVYPAERRVRLEMDAREEYGDRPRRGGEDWPHLLIEQGIRNLPALCELKELRYHCDFRVDYCERYMTDEQFRNDLHTAQVSHFCTVADPHTHDFMWFGVPYFDYRSPVQHGGHMIDCGKADASGKLIYALDQDLFCKTPAIECQWQHYDRDILPDIKKAFDFAKSEGLYPGSRWEDMVLSSHNFGFEMPGTFRAAIEIANLSVEGILKV